MEKTVFGRTFCIVSMIACSVFYALFSSTASVFAWFLLSRLDSVNKWLPYVFYGASGMLLMITPLVSVIGIVLAIIFLKKARYLRSFLMQLLPIGNVLLSLLFLLASMLLGA